MWKFYIYFLQLFIYIWIFVIIIDIMILTIVTDGAIIEGRYNLEKFIGR